MPSDRPGDESRSITQHWNISMSATLDNKVALVTGSARRIGAEIVRTLHADGARVAIHYRGSADDARALADELNGARRDSAAVFQADLLDTASRPALAAAVLDWSGRIDILVNNASSFYPTPIGEISERNSGPLRLLPIRSSQSLSLISPIGVG